MFFRSEYDRHRDLTRDSDEARDKLLDAEIYLDNLQHQAQHLRMLDSQNLLIPIDLRRHGQASGHDSNSTLSSSSSSLDAPSRPNRRRLITAIKARAGATERRNSNDSRRTSFMRGPEPSWTLPGSDGRVNRARVKG
ncbi:hypothetical protein ACM66B_006291 [Microbotryomycetes sp. NB124-2]